MEFNHIPVLLRETIDALCVRSGGIYVDCTAGGGGHSAAILEQMLQGTLVGIDRDPQALCHLRERFGGDARVKIVQSNFGDIEAVLASLGIAGADGILADLGVSSHQLDTAERGFSFHADAPLDMRMDMCGPTAADVVNTYDKARLQKILYAYGEEKFAPAIASAIVRRREISPIETTLDLAEIVKSAVPAAARRDGHPARRTFQALRIEVNGELSGLDEAVQSMFRCLNVGGRLCVITFHSLEDRIVKKRFAELCTGCTCPPDFPVCVCGKTPQGRLPMKAVQPSAKELEENNRSRSAKLRVIEKIRQGKEKGSKMAMKNSAAVRIAAPQHTPRPSKHATAPRLVPQPRKTRTARVQTAHSSRLRVLKIVGVSVCMLVMLSMLIFERASLIKLNIRKAEAEQSLHTAQSETVRLEATFNGMVSVENVEAYARDKLGMVKAQGRQIQFFQNQEEDEILLFNPLEK